MLSLASKWRLHYVVTVVLLIRVSTCEFNGKTSSDLYLYNIGYLMSIRFFFYYNVLTMMTQSPPAVSQIVYKRLSDISVFQQPAKTRVQYCTVIWNIVQSFSHLSSCLVPLINPRKTNAGGGMFGHIAKQGVDSVHCYREEHTFVARGNSEYLITRRVIR